MVCEFLSPCEFFQNVVNLNIKKGSNWIVYFNMVKKVDFMFYILPLFEKDFLKTITRKNWISLSTLAGPKEKNCNKPVG